MHHVHHWFLKNHGRLGLLTASAFQQHAEVQEEEVACIRWCPADKLLPRERHKLWATEGELGEIDGVETELLCGPLQPVLHIFLAPLVRI